MRYSFTGTSRLPTDIDNSIFIRSSLESLDEPDEVYTGGAYGVDTEVHNFATEMWPKAKLFLILPAVPFNEEVLDTKGVIHLWTSEGQTNSKSYMIRNDALVALCDKLIAFPLTATEERRSGTWATVRRAKKANKPVTLFPLSL